MSPCGTHWGWALPSAGIKPWPSGWVDRVGSASLTRRKGMRGTTRSNNQAAHSSPAVIRARSPCREQESLPGQCRNGCFPLDLSLAGPPCSRLGGCMALPFVAVTLAKCHPALVGYASATSYPCGLRDTGGCSCGSKSCSNMCVMLSAFCKSLLHPSLLPQPLLQKPEWVCKRRESPRV